MLANWRDLDIQSMDIILCKGKSGLSKRIRRFQRITGAPKEAAEVTHVAGGFRSQLIDKVYVEESTTLNKFADKRGVQMNPMDEWLPHYNGEVWVRQLTFERDGMFHGEDVEFWNLHKDDDYEHGIPGVLELFLCGLRLNRFFPHYRPKFTSEPHCTELQSKRLEWHGLYNQPVVDSRMPPWLWWSKIDALLTVPISKPVRIK